MQKQLFRQYDIRGKIGTEIDIDDFYNITHAILIFLKQQGDCRSIALGMDGRVHCPAIFNKISAACKDAGVNIYFLGVCSTPITFFAQYHLDIQACLMITASHNPAEYNGLKIYYKKNPIEGGKLQEIYELYSQRALFLSDEPGQVLEAFHIIDLYVDSLFTEFFHLKNFKQPCFIDCGNGVAGPILQKLITKMDWKNITLLFPEVDGTYPHHIADPTDLKNVEELLDQVTLTEGSFGIGLDGDCDRVSVISSTAGLVSADELLALFADSINAKVVVSDIKSSSVVGFYGAQVVLAPTGCANIKSAMDQHHALLGGELSGHFFFQDRHLGYDDGIYGMLRFFDILMTKQVSCNDLVATLPESFRTKDIRIPCSDDKKFQIVQEIVAQLSSTTEFKIIMLDGIRFENEYGWGLIRAANTQPMLSICCQAVSYEKLQFFKNMLINILQQYIDLKLLQQYIL